jgi:eukaryotic-like serine/threonine-protein kinase
MADSPNDAFPKIGSEQWRRIDYLLHAALEREPTERAAFLKNACAGQQELYTEIQSLLACEGQENPLLESSPWPAAGLLISAQSDAFRRGTRLLTENLSAGVQVDRFRITHCLGSGGMGEVYAAEDATLGRNVALKFLALEERLGGAVEQVTREARAASALNHPNIVTVHEVIRHGETPVIVMELIEGAALRTICGTPQPLDRIFHIGRQIAQALVAAHAHGIVHSDIKPENILVRPDGYIKVVDFGLARPVASETPRPSDSLHGGTLRYMSPEQARGEASSLATDIFSFGLILYELATGQHAFPSDSPFGAVYAMLTNEPAASPLDLCVPLPLRLLIFAMLAKDAAARPSAQEVARRLDENILPAKEPERTVTWRQPQLWLPILAVFLLGMGAIGWFLFGRKDSPEFADLSIQPLTSQGGWEASPALSPDGQSIAFTWSEKLDGIRQIYVKPVVGTEPVRLTHSQTEGNIGSLVWSRDGDQIAFERWQGSTSAIYSIARAGGDEKKILDLTSANPSSTIDWSPDGTQLAFSQAMPGSDRLAVYLFNIQTREKRKLTSPPSEDWGDWDPKFSPDGLTIAFKRVTSFWTDDLYLVPAAGGAPSRLTANRRGIWGHAWVSDGRSLIVSCQRGSTLFGLWRFPLRPHAQPERVTQGGIDAVAPATGRKTRQLAWVNQLWDLNIYRVSLFGAGGPSKLIASTLRDQGATYSLDGRIAFISDRSGSREIWLAKSDGSNQVPVTHFNGPYLDHLQWSPDGRRLAFDSRLHGRSDILALDCDLDGMRCGEPQRLTTEVPAEAPSWSAHGEFVYFALNREGRWDIWKQPVVGGRPMQVTRNGGYVSHESPDGKWLYFSKTGKEGIWRIPGNSASGHRPPAADELVIGPPYRPQVEGWVVTPDEIIFIDLARSSQPAAIRAYNVSTKHMRSILTLTEVFSDRGDIGAAVSPDLRWVLYSQLDRSGSNVIVAENRR